MAKPQHPAQAAQQNTPLPGQFFDVPGVPSGPTQWTEQDEDTTNLVTTLSSAGQVPAQGIINFRQTDVVLDWLALITVDQTYTAGTGAFVASAYAPANQIGPTKLVIQNQYASLDVENGIDWYIFNIIRPYRKAAIVNGTNLGANPAGDPLGGSAAGYQAAALAQANNLNAAQWTSGQSAYTLALRIPAGQWFDKYYEMAVTGEPVSDAHPAHVSPQYLAGTTRFITPQITYNGLLGATTDVAPVNNTANPGTSTATGTATLRLRRRAVYAGPHSSMPPVYGWQYRQHASRIGIGGQSKSNLPIPNDAGQVLALFVRLFDPAASAGVGAPININTVSRFSVVYGSGLYEVDWQTLGGVNAAALMQERWYAQHAMALPPGVFALDLALDDQGLLTNARALNTLNTSGISVRLEFTGAQSASAYAMLGVESLVYVT